MKNFYTNPDILEKVFKEFYPRIIGIAYGITNNKEEAKDVASHCFEKLMKMDIEQIEVEKIPALLITMAKNRSIDYCRKVKRRKTQYLESSKEIEIQSYETDWLCEQLLAEDHEARMEKIKELSQSLPPAQKEVFKQRFFEKKPAQEVGKLLQISVHTVNNTYSRAKDNIKEMVNAEGGKNK